MAFLHWVLVSTSHPWNLNGLSGHLDEQVEGGAFDVGELATALRNEVMQRPIHPADITVSIDSDAALVGELDASMLRRRG